MQVSAGGSGWGWLGRFGGRADQPQASTVAPGQLRRDGGLEVATGTPCSSSVKSLVAPARSVTWCSTGSNAEGGPGSGSSDGGASSGVADCWASWMTMPWASRGCRNASFQTSFDRSTPTGSMPSSRARVRVWPRSATTKVK